VKYIDAGGISNLDLQLEVNAARPYTYAHSTQYGSYSNYRQSLAHPLGANFTEWIGIARYQPAPRLQLTAKAFYIKTGRDGAGENWGSDMLKRTNTRQQEYNNTIGQGLGNTIAMVDVAASYMVKHNVFIDARQMLRQSRSDESFYNTKTTLTSIALRWNIPQRHYDF
jgi:hypothetical protein